jgi:hypothetical protein
VRRKAAADPCRHTLLTSVDGPRGLAGNIVTGRYQRPSCRWAPRCGAGAGLANLLGPSQRADIGAGVAAGGGRRRTRQRTQGSRWQPDYRWRGLTGSWRRAWHAHRWHYHHKDTTRVGSRRNERRRGRRHGKKQANAEASASRHVEPHASYSTRALWCPSWRPDQADRGMSDEISRAKRPRVLEDTCRRRPHPVPTQRELDHHIPVPSFIAPGTPRAGNTEPSRRVSCVDVKDTS